MLNKNVCEFDYFVVIITPVKGDRKKSIQGTYSEEIKDNMHIKVLII